MTNPTSERTMTNKPRTRKYTVEAYHHGFDVRVVTEVRVTDSYLIPGAVFVSGDGVLIPASTVTTLGGCSADVVGSDSEAVTAHASAYNCSIESMSPVDE